MRYIALVAGLFITCFSQGFCHDEPLGNSRMPIIRLPNPNMLSVRDALRSMPEDSSRIVEDALKTVPTERLTTKFIKEINDLIKKNNVSAKAEAIRGFSHVPPKQLSRFSLQVKQLTERSGNYDHIGRITLQFGCLPKCWEDEPFGKILEKTTLHEFEIVSFIDEECNRFASQTDAAREPHNLVNSAVFIAALNDLIKAPGRDSNAKEKAKMGLAYVPQKELASFSEQAKYLTEGLDDPLTIGTVVGVYGMASPKCWNRPFVDQLKNKLDQMYFARVQTALLYNVLT